MTDDAAPAPAVRLPTLAAATVALPAAPRADALTVLVTGPDGVRSEGLDAVVAVLVERPELDVQVVVPVMPGEVRPLDASGAGIAAQAATLSGYPAHVVDASLDELVPTAAAALGIAPDLVVIGLVEGTPLGPSAATSDVGSVARTVARAGVPALAIAAGTEHGRDLAAASVMVRALLDTGIDTVLSPGARLLTVPGCDDGLVRGPVAVELAGESPSAADPGCSVADPGPLHDDVSAYQHGYATFVDLPT